MGETFILACDGGGIRGYITASVLQQLTASAGNFLPQVSLNAGTSTGSFISLALAAGVSVDTIQQQYQQANAAPLFTPNPNLSSSLASDRRAASVALDDTSDAAYATMDESLTRFYASPAFANAVAWLGTNFPG